MKNDFKFEIRKLFHNKPFYVCGGVVAVLSVLQVLLVYLAQQISDTVIFAGINLDFYGSDYLLRVTGGMEINIIVPIVVILFICLDFNTGAIKNVLSRGLTRTEVFLGKLSVAGIAAMMYFFLSLVIGVTLSTIIWGFGDFTAFHLASLGIQILCVLAYVAFNGFVAFVFKKAGGALAIGILSSMFVPVLTQLLDLILSTETEEVNTIKYTLTGCIQRASTIESTNSELLLATAVPIVYIVVFGVTGWLFFRRQEV